MVGPAESYDMSKGESLCGYEVKDWLSFLLCGFYTRERLLKSNPMLTGNIYLMLVILYPLAKCFKLYVVSFISSFFEAWYNYAHFID